MLCIKCVRVVYAFTPKPLKPDFKWSFCSVCFCIYQKIRNQLQFPSSKIYSNERIVYALYPGVRVYGISQNYAMFIFTKNTKSRKKESMKRWNLYIVSNYNENDVTSWKLHKIQTWIEFILFENPSAQRNEHNIITNGR